MPFPPDKIFKTLKWIHGHFWKWRGGLVSKKNLGGFSRLGKMRRAVAAAALLCSAVRPLNLLPTSPFPCLTSAAWRWWCGCCIGNLDAC